MRVVRRGSRLPSLAVAEPLPVGPCQGWGMHRAPRGCLGAGVYVPGWPCGGCEGRFPGCSPPSRRLLILLCVCLSVCGADGTSACTGVRRRSRGCPNPQQQSLGWQPFSLPRPARPGTGRGAWQPPHATCVPGRHHTPQLGDGRRDAGRGHGHNASCGCRASRGSCVIPLCPMGLDRITQTGSHGQGCHTSLQGV